MPHTRARSWAQDEPRAAASSWYSNGGNNVVASGRQYGKGGPFYNSTRDNYKHARTRSIPAITSPSEYHPVPYAEPKRRPLSMNAKMENAKLSDRLKPPSPLWLLPTLPGSTYNPRNELQRRLSPTALSFSSSVNATPPLTPLTPTSVHSFSTSRDNIQNPQFEVTTEEPVYVLTLKTSEEIARQMQMLRQKWFSADRVKVPAHITLFHTLPESRVVQVLSHIETLAERIKRFEISTGRIVKTKNGVLVHLETGEDDARRIFVSLRTSWWEWLNEQDKSFKAHWTVQNKEDDPAKVDEAYRDTHRLGTGMGWATGLVLWKYESDGRWTKEKEFEFAKSGREREEPQEEPECDGWPVY